MSSLCPLQHAAPTTVLGGLQICAGHLEALREDLDDIDHLAPLLADMAVPGPGEGNHRGKPVHASPPAVLDALAATDYRTHPDHGDQLVSVVGVITTWTRDLIETRQLASRPATIRAAIALLTTHLDWCAAQDTIDEQARDIHDAAQMLRRIAGELRPPVGRHQAPHPQHPERDCNGRLYPLPWRFGVWCVDCGEQYDGHAELRRLGLVLDAG